MLVRKDICTCGGYLDWGFNLDIDAGLCPNCGEVWYPIDLEDI